MSDSDIAVVAAAASDAKAEAGILRQYYELTKPGISQMVAMTTLAGYYVAIPGDISVFAQSSDSWMHLGATMIGTLCISAGSCALNHVMERHDDARMRRTATRPIPSGRIPVLSATVFGLLLSLGGAALLLTVNMLTFWLAIATWASYLFVYTPMKKWTSLAVIVGGIPGALPFAGGWTAVRGTADAPAWALFAILFFWQLPHFYALSWMYRTDYRDGGFVLRSVSDEDGRTLGIQMLVTSVATMGSAVVPTLLGVTGMLYALGAVLLGGWLSIESLRFLRSSTSGQARRVLLTSYAFLMGIVFLLFLDKR